jgi:hypothetical protein
VDDQDLQLLCCRSRVTAVAVSVVSVVAAVAVLLSPGRQPASAARDAMVPASAVPFAPPGGCRLSDLSAPSVKDMPLPRVVAAPVVIHPDPDFERLAPPDALPRVSAARAWQEMWQQGWRQVTSAGSVEVLLGDLYATTPALIGPGATDQPIYSDRLVWAIYGAHQPELPAGAARQSGPPCYFESTVFYVDALTGRPLEGEVFTADASPSSQPV